MPDPAPVVIGQNDADETTWDLLLDNIEKGLVVPIVGRGLLTVTQDGVSTPLYDVIADRLARVLDVDPKVAIGATSALNAVASQFILNGGEPDDIYTAVAGVMRLFRDWAPPEPLRKLAAIRRFDTFVTTTFDGLLQRAVAEAIGHEPRVLSFSAKPRSAPANDAFGGPLVYHLFGQVSSLQDYVVTEEDALEFVFRLHDARNQPEHFLHQLSAKSLLIIGCSFPSWFVRFFLRLTRGRRLLWSSRDLAAFIVDPGATEDAGLLQFLKAFRTRTLIFTQYSPTAFVDELAARWDLRLQSGDVDQPMAPGAVFLSYASEDFATAERVARAMRAQGLTVWFDKNELQPGDRWQAKIAYNIQQAYGFVPILSAKVHNFTMRQFFYEWSEAIERNKQIAANDRFIFPLVVDDVKRDDPAIPAEIRAVQWSPLIDGLPSPEFYANVTDAVRRKKQGARR